MMNMLLVVICGGFVLFLAARTYPFIISRVFEPDDSRPTPATEFADENDYVASPSAVVFAHHFASIAGAGPIIGPIIALAYGWGPAWIWIVIGGIFYGAVHDMSAMFVSLREGGKTIAEVARRTLGTSGCVLFLLLLLIVISVVNAIFLKMSASALQSAYPLEALGLGDAQTLLRTRTEGGVVKGIIGGIATTSVIVMTIAAPVLGWLIHRKRVRTGRVFMAAGIIGVGGVVLGFFMPVSLSMNAWTWTLIVYLFFASWLPVWLIIQPRDFMNVQVLYGGVLLLVAGTIVAGMSGDGGGSSAMQIPFSRMMEGSQEKGPIWPIMFITIACGAISGFHSLVATGTTIKQIGRESDCRRIGYNAMIFESFLALLVLTAVASQMPFSEYQRTVEHAGGWILTFAIGCGRLFANLGIPLAIGSVLGILIIEGFLVTTLDTSIRLTRYLVEELSAQVFGEPKAATSPSRTIARRIVSTLVAIGLMMIFVLSPQAEKALWPFFGAGNQLIGALTLTTVSVWLLQRGKRAWFTLIPAAGMVVTAIAALMYIVHQKYAGDADNRIVLICAGGVLLMLAMGFVIVATLRMWAAVRRSAKAT
ncbi:MAG: carbon starvation protein A [Phycisphaerales bacterium]|nr:carbon starvation protein A [Phycisphaerales bacterium]